MSLELLYIENQYCVTNSDNHWCRHSEFSFRRTGNPCCIDQNLLSVATSRNFVDLYTGIYSEQPEIMVHSWINPRKPWATKFDDYEIAPDDSFIMFGYGSPVDEFLNKKKPPGKLSPEELKEECIARVRLIPNSDPKFLALAEKCVVSTAYVHVVRDFQAVKRWHTSRMTLIGDAVFK